MHICHCSLQIILFSVICCCWCVEFFLALCIPSSLCVCTRALRIRLFQRTIELSLCVAYTSEYEHHHRHDIVRIIIITTTTNYCESCELTGISNNFQIVPFFLSISRVKLSLVLLFPTFQHGIWAIAILCAFSRPVPKKLKVASRKACKFVPKLRCTTKICSYIHICVHSGLNEA